MPNVSSLRQRRAWSNFRLKPPVPFLDENLSSPDPQVQERAVQAFPAFLREYLRDPADNTLLTERRDKVLEGYLREIDTSELHRRGISLALGEESSVQGNQHALRWYWRSS